MTYTDVLLTGAWPPACKSACFAVHDLPHGCRRTTGSTRHATGLATACSGSQQHGGTLMTNCMTCVWLCATLWSRPPSTSSMVHSSGHTWLSPERCEGPPRPAFVTLSRPTHSLPCSTSDRQCCAHAGLHSARRHWHARTWCGVAP